MGDTGVQWIGKTLSKPISPLAHFECPLNLAGHQPTLRSVAMKKVYFHFQLLRLLDETPGKASTVIV